MYLCNLLNLPLESPSLGCTSSYNSFSPNILATKIPFLYILLEFPSLTTLILLIPYFYFILQFFFLDFYQIMRIYIKLQASNLCCCKSVKVCGFYSQTICVDIQYTDAWFTTLSFDFFYHTHRVILRSFKHTLQLPVV